MKLSTIWTDFDEFLDLCLKTGTVDTKHKMKIYQTYFDENGYYQFDWQKLFDNIIYIFCHDKRLASKFDYSKEFLKSYQEKFSDKYKSFEIEILDGTEEKIKSNDILIKLFEQLKNTSKITLDGKKQFWGTNTDYYKQSDFIYLTKTIETGNHIKVEIIGYINRQQKDYFKVIQGDSNSKNEIILYYLDNKYQYAFNKLTNKRVNLAIKYPEIIHFINAKYFNILLENLSFANFEYLIKSYCEIKNLTVPSNSGELSSRESEQYLFSLENCLKYFETANKYHKNIVFTYEMKKYNKFSVKHLGDEEYIKFRTQDENYWGKLRSANGSRKGRLNINNMEK